MGIAADLLVVAATIEPAVEKQWNEWYDTVHLPEIADCPGFLSAQRYVAEEPDGTRRYLSVYELKDAGALDSAEFKARRGWGPFAAQVTFKTLRYRRITPMERT